MIENELSPTVVEVVIKVQGCIQCVDQRHRTYLFVSCLFLPADFIIWCFRENVDRQIRYILLI